MAQPAESAERERLSDPFKNVIEVWGGKIAATMALQEAGFPVPESRYLAFQDLENKALVGNAFQELSARGPVIVRASHPNDWNGYVDVLPTMLDVRTEEQLLRAIATIKDVAASDALRIHAEDWGQSFSPEVHVLLQEQSPSPIVGAMMRHPHTGNLDMNYVDRVEYRREFGPVYALAHENEESKWFYLDESSNREWGLEEGDLREAMEGYAAVEQSGILDPGWVYQMEMGLHPFKIFQVRPFKPKVPIAPFSVPRSSELQGTPHISSDLVFGITPEEGLVLPCTNEQFFPVQIARDDLRKQYGLLLDGRVRNPIPPWVRMGALALYRTEAGQHAYMVHNEFRPLMRARYGMADSHSHNVNSSVYKGAWDVFNTIRLFSNGDRAVIIPES